METRSPVAVTGVDVTVVNVVVVVGSTTAGVERIPAVVTTAGLELANAVVSPNTVVGPGD